MLHRGEEVFVQHHRLVVTLRGKPSLIHEPLALDHRVDQLRIARSQLEATHIEVPLLGDACFATMLPGQRRSLHWKVAHESRRVQLVAILVFPQFLDKFPVAVALVLRNFQTDPISECQ